MANVFTCRSASCTTFQYVRLGDAIGTQKASQPLRILSPATWLVGPVDTLGICPRYNRLANDRPSGWTVSFRFRLEEPRVLAHDSNHGPDPRALVDRAEGPGPLPGPVAHGRRDRFPRRLEGGQLWPYQPACTVRLALFRARFRRKTCRLAHDAYFSGGRLHQRARQHSSVDAVCQESPLPRPPVLRFHEA